MHKTDQAQNRTMQSIGRYRTVSVDVIIPTYKPDQTLDQILKLLSQQTCIPSSVIIFNTEEQYWNSGSESIFPVTRVRHISKHEFDHGGTRHAAACSSSADIIVFMTQDAVPVSADLIEQLIAPIVKGEAKVSYARQLPKEDAGLIERTGREFNYPSESRIKSAKDIESMGIKTFFCSDVCAAYDRLYYMESGGFPRPVIFNEDMIFAGRTIESGEQIAYAAEAKVFHSHNLSSGKQFKRNFDLGVSQKDYEEFFNKYPSVGEGKKLIKLTADRIKEAGKYYLLFPLFWSGVSKFAGYWFGKHYKKLPMGLIRKMSSDPGYWKRKDKNDNV